MTDIDKKIISENARYETEMSKLRQAHEDEIKRLSAEKNRLAALSPEAKLAEALHDTTCRWNHTDQCGWFYEIHDSVVNWDGHSHSAYLTKARKLRLSLPDVTVDMVIKIMNVVKGVG